MAEVLGDICFPAGKYIKDGEEKTRWMRCGIALKTDKGIRLKLEAVPAVVGEQGMWFSVFEKENQPRAPQQQSFREPVQNQQDDDTPF